METKMHFEVVQSRRNGELQAFKSEKNVEFEADRVSSSQALQGITIANLCEYLEHLELFNGHLSAHFKSNFSYECGC